MRRCPALAALLVVGIVASGCSAERAATAVGDHAGLDLQLELSSTNGVLVARTVVRNTRAHPISLDADQCGRVADVVLARTTFEPDGETQTGSVAAVKRIILADQRSREDPERFAPRTLGGSEVPQCQRPDQPVSLAAGASIEERRELPIGASSGLAAVGSANTIVRAEAVEAVAPDRITFLDSLPTGATEEQRAGRSVTVEIPTSSVLERAPTRPNVGPSLGQVFDRIVENNRLAPSSRPSHLAPGAMPVCVSPSTDRASSSGR